MLKKQWGHPAYVVFDELHKFPRWKNWIKGVYDTEKKHLRILVTGSARLDVYRRGGDSLLGRYHYWRLHPFTLSEYPPGLTPQEAFDRLMQVGGFPEPFLSGDEREARRWRRERTDRILKDDIRDLESLRDVASLSLFVDQLRSRVGGLVAVGNLSQEIQISPKTLKHWLEVLENMYLTFSVKPYTKKLPRAIQKPPKVYFFDNADVAEDPAARFENLVATHLLKRIHFLEDYEGHRYVLNYLRDKEGREVDFVITKNGVIEELVEVKWSDSEISKSLLYYTEKLKPKRATQIVANLKQSYSKGLVKVMDPIEAFSKEAWSVE